MSEHDEQRPLTRRERRLRELAETGAMDLQEVADSAAAEPAAEAPSEPRAPLDAESIEISPFNEDGTPRSRREMRALREQALAAAQSSRAEEQQTDAGESIPVGGEQSAETVEQPVEAAEPVEEPAGRAPEPRYSGESEVAVAGRAESAPEAAEEAAPREAAVPGHEVSEPETAEAVETGAVDFDTLISPPTEPFTLDELREAEQAPEPESQDGVEKLLAEVEEPESAPEEPAQPEPRRFSWRRNRAARAEAEAETQASEASDASAASEEVAASDDVASDVEAEAGGAEDAAEPVEVVEAIAVPMEDVEASETSEAPPTVVVDAVEETGPDAQAALDTRDGVGAQDGAGAEEAPTEAIPAPKPARPAEAASAADAAPSGRRGGGSAPAEGAEQGADDASGPAYSFPDIVPPEEWRSVFDDPSSRTVPEQGSGGDFDDLISRAVAQEGAAGTTNSSALILPSMPDDTGGLAGPIGATGELYVTGSIELPKSLGETGGHASIHDSIELDPFLEAPAAPQMASDEGPAPVAARRAVSAQMSPGMSVVAKPTREKSKLPMVLAITGGGLVVVVVGLGIWGATQGLFG